MKENLELEKQDLAIDHDIQVSSDDPKVIDFLLETWFDVDKKFGINIVAVKDPESGFIDVSPNPAAPLAEGRLLVVIGSNEDIKKLTK